ncbi:PREDICTED: dynein assembly factor 1, axonemal homolog [Drosophila arizonae]|uniref:Dynein axonemal assembly factor 1 homolog n=1 Tax=Drosophila arizonae TaxID=7263 RepID=A0ABM1NZF6_DROAR|nr:PREDICTED: dynein assembly factor 1, axonemal homolog [Drosophila arizonae]
MSQAVAAGAAAPRKEVTGLHRMTQQGLRELCKKDKLYQTPRLNDVLYLHYQGYQYIECLDEYTELKCLWLECNAISEIEGLEKQSKLRCLFLQNNLIKRIENLGSCPLLDTLNLSSNHIRLIENIGTDVLPVLNTLNISSNYLKDSESLARLVDCKTLAVLDLSNNRIDDILVVKIFEKMPCLKVLVLHGNPVVSRLPQYRKTLILACKELTYLDSRPVFPRDRACAEAWKREGYEGERKENRRWNRADRKKMRDSVNYTIQLRNRHRPADQQDALISSTDSEAEAEADKGAERTRVKADLEYGCVDDIWSEVSGDNKEENESTDSSRIADEATGSQDEELAEHISNRRAKPLDGRPKVLYESQFADNEEDAQKEINKGLAEEVENTNDNVVAQKEVNETDVKAEEKRGVKRLLIEEVKLEPLDVECKAAEVEKEQADKAGEAVKADKADEAIKHDEAKEEGSTEEKEINPEVKEAQDELKNLLDEVECKEIPCIVTDEVEAKQIPALVDDKAEDSESKQIPALIANEVEPKQMTAVATEPESGSELDQTARAELDKSCQKLKAIALNEGGDPTPEQIKQNAIDRMYESYGDEIFVEQPEFNKAMLEPEEPKERQELKAAKKESTGNITTNNIIKTKEQLEYEAECIEANEIVEYNMQELSSQMDEDLKELSQPLEEIRATQDELQKDGNNSSDEEKEQDKKKCIELTTVTHSLRIIEEFSVRRERICAQEEEQQKVQIEELEMEKEKEDELDAAFAKALDSCTDDVPMRVFGEGCDQPSHEWHKEECMRQLTITETRTEQHEDEEMFKVKPLNANSCAEQAELICEEMSQKLEAEENSLRELLQQLEDETDVLYDITSAVEDEELEKLPEPPVDEVCAALIHDLIDELQYQEIINGQNIKCFDFGVIESDEEYSYSADPQTQSIVPPELEDPAGGKSLRECLDAFGNFLTSVKERKKERKLDRKETSSSEKVSAAKALLKSKMKNAYMDESPREVEAQLAKQEEKRKRRVAAMADRCFSKRDSYEDTLEVVDNKLMIVKKDTGEIQDLPPPPALISDTESESDNDSSAGNDPDAYDTAEEINENKSESPENRNLRANWPKADPAELELSQASLSLKDGDGVEDQSIDQFYSLEARAAFNSLDSEFLDKLDLQKVIGVDGEITVEGMRSYDELTADDVVQKAEHPGALVKQDEMLKDLIERQHLQEERERQMEELSKDLGAHKLKCKSITDQLESELKEAKATTNFLQMLNNLECPKEEELGEKKPTGNFLKMLNWGSPKEKELKEDAMEEQQQQEERDEELDNGQEYPTIQLTLGACKLCEIKSQVANTKDEEEEAAEKAKAAAAEESELKLEEITANSEQVDEKAEEKSSNEMGEKSEGKPTPTVSGNIDDDIISDASTDYESGEDIAVVEPPRLPEGALTELFSNQFDEDGLKLERENEEALRKKLFSLPLRAWASHNSIDKVGNMAKEKQVSESAETTDADDESCEVDAESCEVEANKESKKTANEDDDDTESGGAIDELARNAKRQWAKISQKLSEFIEADDLKLLDKSQFNEENSDGDDQEDELEESLKKLNIIYEECEAQIKNARPEYMQVWHDEEEEANAQEIEQARAEEAEEPGIDLDKTLEANELEETEIENEQETELENILEANEQQLEEEETEETKKQELEQGETLKAEEQELVLNETEETRDQEAKVDHAEVKEDKRSTNLEPIGDDQPLLKNPSKPPIILDYFEDNTDTDSFHTIPELKTEEIECNLEILDDDAIVKEVSVNAQVTYELKNVCCSTRHV